MKLLMKFFHLPAKERAFFAEALTLLWIARIMLILFPFRICIKTIQKKKKGKQASPDILDRIRHSTIRANRTAIWKNICLVQSFAARWMLQRRGIESTMTIGVARDAQGKMIAHAWLSSGDFQIVAVNGGFVTLISY